MKNLYLKSLILLSFLNTELMSQCPIITCPATLSIPCSTVALSQPVVATSDYSANITSRWIARSGAPLVSSGKDLSIVNIGAPGTYTVEFRDNVSNCVSTKVLTVTGGPRIPRLYFYSNSSNDTFTMSSSSATMDISFCVVETTWLPPAYRYAFGPSPVTPSYSANGCSFNVNTCGDYIAMVKNDTSGCIASNTLSIREPGVLCQKSPLGLNNSEESAPLFKVFPNPVSQQLIINTDNQKDAEYNLFDLAGREILKGKFSSSTSLDLAKLNTGPYILRLKIAQFVSYKKIIVAR